MPNLFAKYVDALSDQSHVFDATSALKKVNAFKKIASIPFQNGKALLSYHALLLFHSAYPENKVIYLLAQKELNRLAKYLKKRNNAANGIFNDTGLPFTTMTTRFSQDAFNELMTHEDVTIQLESLENEDFDLNSFCNITLPTILKEETTAALKNEELLTLLGVADNKKFDFLLNEINQLDAVPLAKDFLWQLLQSFFTITGKNKTYSKSFNKIEPTNLFFTKKLLKEFDEKKMLDQKIGKPIPLTKVQKDKLITVIKNTMTLSMREIDPVTYMDAKSLQFYNLPSGLSIALCGMIPERQLPLQSYISYTLFKNGYPISYGGAWVFGKWSLFALNIFEEYRGGESKYVMTQILRVYRQLYGIDHFEVEPFQFGNEEALQTGAFWFYYKFGFRPIDKEIDELANKELIKIQKNKSYRSNYKILKQLAQGNIVLHLSAQKSTHRNEIMKSIIGLIGKKYKGNYKEAIEMSKKFFLNNAPNFKKLNTKDEKVFEEMALWAFANNIKDPSKLSLMTKMIQAKSKNSIVYNQLIQKII